MWKRWIPAAVGLFTSLACAGLPAGGAADDAPPGVVLAPAPRAEGDLVVSPDLEHALHARSSSGGSEITLDGEPFAKVGRVIRMGFLPDGTPHVAYEQGTSKYLRIGARRRGPYEELGGAVRGAGGHSAYQAKRSGRWHTVVDGDDGASWEITSPAFLTETGHAAWLGQQDGRTVVIHDGREVATADEAFLKVLSEGGRLGWAGRAGNRWRAYVGGEALPGSWAAVGAMALEPRVAYAARDRSGWWVVDGRQRKGPYAETGPVSFAPDGRLVWFEGGERWRMHVGDWTSPPVAEIGDTSPVFHGSRFLWWSRGDGGAKVWVGDEVVASVVDVADIAPWFAGGRPTFAGRDAQGWRVWVGSWHTAPALEIAQARTSSDGAHLAVVLRDARGWGVDLYRVGTDEPVGSWRGPVATERGGGVRFVGDALWFTQVEGGELVRREIPLAATRADARVRSPSRGR